MSPFIINKVVKVKIVIFLSKHKNIYLHLCGWVHIHPKQKWNWCSTFIWHLSLLHLQWSYGHRGQEREKKNRLVTSPSKANSETHRTNNFVHTFIPKGNLERSIKPTVMLLHCGRKPEYLEGTHRVNTKNYMKKDRHSSPWPSCSKATVMPTPPPCSSRSLLVCHHH